MRNSKLQDELQQQLWELVYDLLSDAETEALCQRVTSEPDVARAYARIKAESELVAAAARIDTPLIEMERSVGQGQREEHPVVRRAKSASVRRNSAAQRFVNWLVSTAALLLVGFVAYSSWRANMIEPAEHGPIARRTERLRTIVTSPAVFHSAVTNPLAVRTVALDGAPISTEVELRLYGASGNLVWSEADITDGNGNWQVELPGSKLESVARVEVLPRGSDPKQAVSSELQVAHSERLTYLSVDRPYYRPGETIYFRSLTLSRFDHRVDDELAVRFEVRDASGRPVSESQVEGTTESGVGNGWFTIPADLAGGKYTCVALSPTEEFPEEHRDVFVHRYELPLFKTRLQLHQSSYGPSDDVIADFSAERLDGTVAAHTKLTIRASVDGQQLVTPERATTDERGSHRIRFALPDVIRRGGEGMLAVTVGDDDGEQTISKNIVINLGRVEVDFYPEGGDLVPELPNRVYFYSRDPLGRPVHLEGAIIDAGGDDVATLQTQHAGRGRFDFVPQVDQQYSVRVDKPNGTGDPPQFPDLATDQLLVMQTGPGVFEPGDPLSMSLYATRPLGPLVISAGCRGAIVGLMRVESSEFERLPTGIYRHRSVMALAPEAAGVIRVTVYQYAVDGSPALPLAERLVFRRSTQTLSVAIEDLGDSNQAGESLALSFVATDENGKPQPAVLGVVAVDDALINLADDKSPFMPTYYYLTTEIARPQDLEDANFFLSNDEGAAEALDLLLGTQGWRQFVGISPSGLALGETNFGQSSAAVQPPVGSNRDTATFSIETGDAPSPPVTLARETARAVPQVSMSRRARRLSWLNHTQIGRVALVGGAGLLIVLAISACVRWPGSLRTSLLPAGLATVCLIVGAYLLMPSMSPGLRIASAPSSGVDVSAVKMALPNAIESKSVQQDLELLADEETESEPAGGFAGGETKYAEPQGRHLSTRRGQTRSELPFAERPLADRQALNYGEPAAAPRPMAGAGAESAGPAADVEPIAAADAESGIVKMKQQLDRLLVPRQQENLGTDRFKLLSRARAMLAAKDETAKKPTPPSAPVADQRSERPDSAIRGRTASAATFPQATGESDEFIVRRYAFRTARGSGAARENFDTIFWDPLLITDQDGRATVRFDLPSVGVYHLRVDGHHNGRLGSAEAKIVSQ